MDDFDPANVDHLLRQGAADAIELEDYLLYLTIVDICLAEPELFPSTDARAQALATLLEVLQQHPNLTHEIGWDIPAVVLPFVEADHDHVGPLRDAPCTYKVLKIFEVLATTGNPKELFLKSCELLTELDVRAELEWTENTDVKIGLFEIKLYAIFELIDASLKRIQTWYPLRFLAMTVTSYINMIARNGYDLGKLYQFVLRRCFQFARNYQGMPHPKEGGDPTAVSDEETLQRRLLTAFVTEAVSVSGKGYQVGFTVDHVSMLQEPLRCQLKHYIDFALDLPVLDRLYELVQLFDLDPLLVFQAWVARAATLVPASVEGDDAVGLLFEKVVADYAQHSLRLVNAEATKVTDLEQGLVFLYTYRVAKSRQFTTKVLLRDAVAMAISGLVPAMVQPLFRSEMAEDACVFWLWYALHDLLTLDLDSLVLLVLFQVLLHVITSTRRSTFRFCTTTLLTKLLTMVDEDTAYGFIVDTLENCPFENIEVVLVGIFKELLTKDRAHGLCGEKKANDNTLSLDKLSLDDKENPLKKDEKETSLKKSEKVSAAPPPLPSRKFITLNDTRALTLFDILAKLIENTFVEEDGAVQINPLKFGVLSLLLNLLVVIRALPVFNEPIYQKSVTHYCNVVEEKVSEVKAAPNDPQTNAADLIRLTLSRVRGEPVENDKPDPKVVKAKSEDSSESKQQAGA